MNRIRDSPLSSLEQIKRADQRRSVNCRYR